MQWDPAHDIGSWLLYHPHLRRTKRVTAFREHMIAQMASQSALFEGK